MTKPIFGEMLRECMASRGVTQMEMAQRVGVSQGSVSGWLAGSVPRMDRVLKIAEVLGLNPDYVLNPDKYRLPFSVAAEAVKGMEEGPPRDREYNRVLREETEKLKARQEGWEAASDVVREDPPWVDQWRDRALAAEALLDQFRELLDRDKTITKKKGSRR